jgi:ankyrin repeat protein
LTLASNSFNVELVQELLSMQADVNLANNSRNAPLHVVLRKYISTSEELDTQLRLVNVLLLGRANVFQEGKSGTTPLKLATFCRTKILARILHALDDEQLEKAVRSDDIGMLIIQSNLRRLAMFPERSKVVSKFFEEKLGNKAIDVNAKSEGSTGQTALMAAVEFGNLNFVKKLIDNGADLNILDSKGRSALDYVNEAMYDSAATKEIMRSLLNGTAAMSIKPHGP